MYGVPLNQGQKHGEIFNRHTAGGGADISVFLQFIKTKIDETRIKTSGDDFSAQPFIHVNAKGLFLPFFQI